MSWETFKQNVLRVANSPEGISDIDVVAESYAKEYDSAVKRGFDKQHKIPLVSGNVEMMKTFFKSALQKGVNSTQPYDLVGEMGEGVKAYWAGAVMATSPLPITPAIQATVNLSVTQNIVTNPGVWQQPILSLNVNASEELTPEKRIEYQEALEEELEQYNKFIAENKILLATTVKDAINKLTGILDENIDYNVEVPVQNAILGIVPGASVSITPPPVPAPTPTPTPTPTPAAPTTPTATGAPTTPTTPTSTPANTDDLPDLGFFELDSGTTIKVSESDDEFGQIKFNQGKPFVSGFRGGGGGGTYSGAPYVPFNNFNGNTTVGEKVVQLAVYDAGQGVVENGKDTGHPRIEAIQEFGNGPWGGGSGFPWCACTVVTWWAEAGFDVNGLLLLPNGYKFYWPGVPNWTEWAIRTGRYVDMTAPENAKFVPKAGDAIIYDWPNDDEGASNHIGIFWKIDSGFWWGVDGNKSKSIKAHCIKDMKPVQGVVRI